MSVKVILSALLLFAGTRTARAGSLILDWTPGSAPTGSWFTSWGGENAGARHTVVGSDGSATNACVVWYGNGSDAQKWIPYQSGATALTNFTVAVYGCADMVKPSADKLGVIWCMGAKSAQKTALVKDSNGNLELVRVSGTATNLAAVINAGAVKGYHLFTVRFNSASGASLQVDDGPVCSDTAFTTTSGNGIQIGSVLSGISSPFERGVGFVMLKMLGYDTDELSDSDYSALVAQYPAVTTMKPLDYSAASGTVYLPSLTLSSGALRIQQGTLNVPDGVEASLSALEFGDLQGSPNYGMDLAGTVTINTSSTGSNNGYDQAYEDCNNGKGVDLGEWTGTGTYTITGTFNASNTYVEIIHDASAVTLNVDGGTFMTKGLAAKDVGATVNLMNGGTLNLGSYPSAEKAIVKNYGAGTVVVTASATDTDDINFTDAETGTTFRLDGVTLTLSGALTGESNTVNVVTSKGGALVCRAGTFTSGTYTVEELMHRYVVSVDGVRYEDYVAALAAAVLRGSVLTLLDKGDADALQAAAETLCVTLTPAAEAKAYRVACNATATEAVLRMTEIMPKPTDGEYDANGLASGWVDLTNTSTTAWADLADYKFLRVNRGKATSKGDYGNFPSVMIGPGQTYRFRTSERYDNSADMTVSAWATANAAGVVPVLYGTNLNSYLVWPDKVNPKKFCFVRLSYAPGGTETGIVDTVVIPADLPESYSIVIDPTASGKATSRWMQPRTSTGETTGTRTALGPNVGPLYELATQAKHDSASEFAAPQPPAVPGEKYTVTFALNPVMSPTEAGGFRAEDAITNIVMLYRSDLTNAVKRIPVELATRQTDSADLGDRYTAEIEAEDLPAQGHLMQWKFEIADAAGNTWTSPAFLNKDDGYEWYGTIVEPTDGQMAEHLATWHMFADADSVAQMDTDADKQSLANGARVAIYDSSTSNYYDYVRIDLRGNTSAGFTKKSHGLRFCKPHPLATYDPVRGTTWKEIRKTSLIGEPADPSRLRQLTSFWLWDKMGNKVPFDFPVRCNLNGKFYQVGFNSERFTDELVEDVYGFDKYGFSYKNVGTLASASATTAGGIEKKTPDDGDESDISVLQNELRQVISDAGAGRVNNDNTNLTKVVVERFDLAAWLNYLASARITHEMDDVWANISMYYDNPTMKGGARGTGTWMPLGYDFNLSLGAYYREGGITDVRPTLMANQDWFKSHPFYGGMTAVCYLQTNFTSQCNGGNYGLESVLQSSKFRRLFLRRLRTLMDRYLGAPNANETFETTTSPIIAKMKEVAALMGADGDLDRTTWPWDSSIAKNDDWGSAEAFPSNILAGVEEIYTGYIVPRREHLYVTHSVTNTAFEIGYGQTLNAGIPLAQSDLAELKDNIGAAVAEDGVVVITNLNAEVVDMSGWTVSGPVTMTLPAGTVVDLCTNGVAGALYVVTDRKAYVAAHEATLTDEFIVGNATAGAGELIGLKTADGETVIAADVVLTPGTHEAGTYDMPVSLSGEGEYEFKGLTFNAGLTIPGGTYTLKNAKGCTNTASTVTSEGSIVFTGKGMFSLTGAADSGTLMTVGDLYVSNGTFYVESKATTSNTCAVVVNGDLVVEDKGTVSVKLSKKTVCGIALSQQKKNKTCRIGSGGTFLAEINGTGGCALQSEKKGVSLSIDENTLVLAVASGANATCFNLTNGVTINGGIVYELVGDGSDLQEPNADGQAYATLETDSAACYVTALARSDAARTRYYFEKPKGGVKALVSLPGLTGDAAAEASVPDEATLVVSAYWTLALPVNEIAPDSEGEALAATNAVDAAAEAATYEIVLSDADVEAGLTTNSLVVVAEAVTNASGDVTGYRAVVAVDSTTVAAPTVGGGTNTVSGVEEIIAPLLVEEATDGGSVVSIGVNNAVKGLWYGCAVADEITADYVNDASSFQRATNRVIKITGAKRTQTRGFFRVKVLPAPLGK